MTSRQISSVTRATPAYGKDWNEQLQGRASELDVSQWRLVALALGKPDTYVVKIMKVINSEQALSSEAQAAMQQDFSVYKQLSSNLWQWYQIAQASGYPQAYLKRIASVAIALHHSQKPIPLSIEALSAMQQDVNNYNRANRNHHHL